MQIFIFFVIPISFLLVVIAFGSSALHQRGMRALVGERDERAARSAAQAINEQLNHRAAAIQGLGLRANDNPNLSEVLSSSQFLYQDFDAGIAVFSTDGILLSSSEDSIFTEIFFDEYSQELLELIVKAKPKAIFSAPIKVSYLEDYVVFVASTSSEEKYIVMGAFSPAIMTRNTLAGLLGESEQASAFLFDQQQQILYQIGHRDFENQTETLIGVEEALRGESGVSYVDIDEKEHVIAFSPIPATGWALVLEEPWESVSNPLLTSTQVAPLILVPLLLFALFALFFGARQIIQPLQALESKAVSLAWGDYKIIEEPVGGIEEIRRLQNELINLSRKVQVAQEGLKGYIGAITTGQEEERNRLARELHDDTLQTLIALNQRLQLAERSMLDGEPKNLVSEIQTLTEDTIDNLRNIIRALRPQYLADLGLVSALQMLTQETNRNTDVEVAFELLGKEIRLSETEELSLYRIAQEALNNVTRHSESTKSIVHLSYDQDFIGLQISDNGKGFKVPTSPTDFVPEGHFGLLGLYERAELIGASLEIKSTIDDGTEIIVKLPNISSITTR